MTRSLISWAERSDWNPVRGCSRVSEGCRNCYAERIAGRFSAPGLPFHGFAEPVFRPDFSREARWTGRVELIPDRLTLPLKWRKPATIFVNSTSDIFHERLPDEAIDQILAVMALASRHRFIILTKRAARMRQYFSARGDWRVRVATLLNDLKPSSLWNGNVYQGWQEIHGKGFLPNVALGVSAEDQATANERIPHLLSTPAACRLVSAEPLLGSIDLTRLKEEGAEECWTKPSAQSSLNCLTGHNWGEDLVNGRWEGWNGEEDQPSSGFGEPGFYPPIDGVLTGGESGQGARPMHPDWARSLRDQCAGANTAFHFKQWGEYAPGEVAGEYLDPDKPARGMSLIDGRWIEDWSHPEGHCDDEPDVYRIGKKRAGATLDGIEHRAMPDGWEVAA